MYKVGGYKTPVDCDVLWNLNRTDTSAVIVPEFEKQWSKQFIKAKQSRRFYMCNFFAGRSSRSHRIELNLHGWVSRLQLECSWLPQRNRSTSCVASSLVSVSAALWLPPSTQKYCRHALKMLKSFNLASSRFVFSRCCWTIRVARVQHSARSPTWSLSTTPANSTSFGQPRCRWSSSSSSYGAQLDLPCWQVLSSWCCWSRWTQWSRRKVVTSRCDRWRRWTRAWNSLMGSRSRVC